MRCDTKMYHKQTFSNSYSNQRELRCCSALLCSAPFTENKQNERQQQVWLIKLHNVIVCVFVCVCSQCPKRTRRILNFIDDLCVPRVAFNFSSPREIFTHFAAVSGSASASAWLTWRMINGQKFNWVIVGPAGDGINPATLSPVPSLPPSSYRVVTSCSLHTYIPFGSQGMPLWQTLW